MNGRIAYQASIIRAGILAGASLKCPGAHQDPWCRRDNREERGYQRYIVGLAGDYRAFCELSLQEQRAYWSWRRTHQTEL